MYEQFDEVDEWVKSVLCGVGPDCVEVSVRSGGVVAVRDSKHPQGPVLEFTRSEWAAFAAGVRAGQFDVE